MLKCFPRTAVQLRQHSCHNYILVWLRGIVKWLSISFNTGLVLPIWHVRNIFKYECNTEKEFLKKPQLLPFIVLSCNRFFFTLLCLCLLLWTRRPLAHHPTLRCAPLVGIIRLIHYSGRGPGFGFFNISPRTTFVFFDFFQMFLELRH